MSTYAIGDVQGCMRTLEFLLDRIDFEPGRDRLWLVGDLVNRGPASLEVLRWCRRHDAHLRCVLGNHDLHLLARARGVHRAKRRDTLDEILDAPDADELLAWLERRPLVHREDGFLMVHAGLLPAWSDLEIDRLARAGEDALRGSHQREWLERLAERRSERWDPDASDEVKTETAIRSFCNLRGCDRDGQPVWEFSGPPQEAPEGVVPWYAHPDRKARTGVVVCGHWAAQGLRLLPDLLALDTGCVWGGTLTAVELETRETTAVPLQDAIDESLRRPSGDAP